MIKVPADATKYIVLQRLETQKLGGGLHYTPFYKAINWVFARSGLLKSAFAYYSTSVEPRFRGKKIARDYGQVMLREFTTIQPHLPSPLRVSLSIGPGVCGLEAAMSEYLRGTGGALPLFILVDKTGIDKVHYGFRPVAAAYNSMELGRDLLVSNGTPEDNIVLVDAANVLTLSASFEGRVDLVTSLIAWGFHFPVQVYLPIVLKLLSPAGRLIIDTRKGTGGRRELESAFHFVKVIFEDEKLERVLATGPRGGEAAA